MTDIISLDSTEQMNDAPHLDDEENLEAQDEGMNGVTEDEETKKTSRTRKRERPQKSSEAGITEVENMNDVGNLEDDVTEKDEDNLTDVALKQEVWRRQCSAPPNATSMRLSEEI